MTFDLSGDARRIAAAALEVDPDRSNIILLVGTKGSGKSEAARVIFDAWPYDRVMVDITGDARPDDPATIAVSQPFPPALPEPDEESPDPNRVTIWARLDPRRGRERAPGQPGWTMLDLDHDDVMALGLYPRNKKILLLIDEYGRAATATKIPPNVDLGLMSSRHYNLTLVLCCPRPKRIPVLTIEQADKVIIYDTPNPDDRETLAKNMGYPVKLFEEHYEATMRRGPHSFLVWDKRQKVLVGCPALPLARTHGPSA
jgi:hypothetical protein